MKKWLSKKEREREREKRGQDVRKESDDCVTVRESESGIEGDQNACGIHNALIYMSRWEIER